MVFESTDSQPTRTSLLERATDRDPAAWRELVELYGPLIAYWCGRCGLDAHATADCTQDVFSAVSRSLDRFERQESSGSFRAWLWTITANKVKDRLRAEARVVRGDGGSTALRRIGEIPDPNDLPAEERDSRSGAVPEQEPTDDLQLSRLMARGLALVRKEFAEKTWRIFERAVLDDIATAQVAEEFGVKAATVRQTRSRILRRLRQHLGDFGSGDR